MRTILLAGSILMVGLASPVIAKTVTQSRDVSSFSKVTINGSIDANVMVGEAQSVSIRADDREIDRIETSIKGDTLVIKMKGNFRKSRDMLATITVPELTALRINGSSDADIRNVDSDDFQIGISGSGDVSATGRCGEADYRISGSGDISAQSLQCESVTVRISGSGDADVHASSDITIGISGSGDVTSSGNPTVKKVRISGSGSFEMQD